MGMAELPLPRMHWYVQRTQRNEGVGLTRKVKVAPSYCSLLQSPLQRERNYPSLPLTSSLWKNIVVSLPVCLCWRLCGGEALVALSVSQVAEGKQLLLSSIENEGRKGREFVSLSRSFVGYGRVPIRSGQRHKLSLWLSLRHPPQPWDSSFSPSCPSVLWLPPFLLCESCS